MVKRPYNKPLPVAYTSIEASDFPNLDYWLKDKKWLNSDLKNIYLRAKALISGDLSPELAVQKTGNISGARWVTKGKNIVFFY